MKPIVNSYLTVLYHISQGLNPTQIGKKYNWKKSKVAYYIKGLKQEELIERVGYGTWKTTSKQVRNYLKDGENNLLFSKKVRGHGFQFKVKVKRKLINWDKRVEYLTKKKFPFTLVGNKGSIVRVIIKGHKIWLCNNSIVVYYPTDISFFARSAKKSRVQAIHYLYSILSKLETILGVNLKIGKEYLFDVPKRHYANLNNELAAEYVREGKRLEVRDRKGELWALIGNSHNIPELETVHPKTAEKDTDEVMIPIFNTFRENPSILAEIKLDSEEMKLRLKELSSRLMESIMVTEQIVNKLDKR